MAQMTLADVSTAIAAVDIAMLSTVAANGCIAARPMSNNGDVEYRGDNYFFAFEDSNTVQDIKRNPNIGLSFAGSKNILSKRIFVSIEAQAELIVDKVQFKAHWNKDIEAWAAEGVDTPGLVLIRARAIRVHYWSGNNDQEIAL